MLKASHQSQANASRADTKIICTKNFSAKVKITTQRLEKWNADDADK
ncbi:MAG: hypothetical protein Q7T40_05110 [Methylobacter sp.]|nr:hypothetical protein [Methylobacter sp.]